MFFVLSKVIYFVVQPSSAIVLLMAAGLLAAFRERWRKTGLRAVAAGLALLVVAGLSPLGNALFMPLERRFPAIDNHALPEDVAGFIVLGGAEDMRGLGARRELGLNEQGERFTETARLARAHPGLKVVFTGGIGILFETGVPNATSLVAEFLTDMGIGRDRLTLEGKSRNTFENAELTKPLLGNGIERRWLLVTSAYHMPRAMGVFRRAGYDVVAFPVDFRTDSVDDLMTTFGSVPAGLERVDLAVKEWIGLVAYRLAGYTDSLFPEP